MPLSKFSFLIVYILFVCFMTACQKEASYDQLEGTFYVKRQQTSSTVNGNQRDNYRKESDLFVECTVEQNTLNVLGVALPISSPDQTDFYVDNLAANGDGWMRVRFLNDYSNIRIQYYWPDPNNSAIQGEIFYSGERSLPFELASSGTATYDFKVWEKVSSTGVDTQYIKEVVVNHARSSSVGITPPDIPSITFNFDNKQLNFKNLVREARNTHMAIGPNNQVSTIERVYWKNDSLYIYRDVRSINSAQGTTSIEYYQYKGRKK